MQCIFALELSREGSLEKQQEFLNKSISQTFTLYLLLLSLFKEIHLMSVERVEKGSRKYLTEDESATGSLQKLSENKLLRQISDNDLLNEALKKRKLRHWYLNEEYVKILLKDILKSELYLKYAAQTQSYNEDRDFLIRAFREIIAPNQKIYDFLEDEGITWVDDLPLVNTFILKQFRKVKPDSPNSYFMPPLLKNKEDMEFARELLNKSLLKQKALEAEMEGKTPNWDKDRIAEMDAILLKMAISELLYFPSIPERVTINEYLEIAKEYSTPKSSIFINGVLDKLIKDYKATGKLKKSGRGLL